MPSSRTDSLSPSRKPTSCSLPTIHDTIIIGAGPSGLATAARLREPTPSALFTDEEHHRYHWIRRHAGHAAIKNSQTGNVRRLSSRGGTCCRTTAEKTSAAQPSMLLVLDAAGATWMARWKRLFAALEIRHLRSPMFFHPDPRDRDGLLAYCHGMGREDDCLEITGCVGKERSKHQMKKRRRCRKAGEQAKPSITIDERERKDYFTPPADVFESYCDSIAARYDLLSPDLIQHATLTDVDYDYITHLSPDERVFTLTATTPCGETVTYYARTAVLALGAGNAPAVPAPFLASSSSSSSSSSANGHFPPQTTHAFHTASATALHPILARNTALQRTTHILVLGGGLTSVQLIDRILRHHHHHSYPSPSASCHSTLKSNIKIHLVTRSPLKIKPFDISLNWMGKFRNHEKASFWSADSDEERSEMIKIARGGGSVTGRFARILKMWVEVGAVEVWEGVRVEGAEFVRGHGRGGGGEEDDEEEEEEQDGCEYGYWKIRTSLHNAILEEIEFDHISFATGVDSDIRTLPCLATMHEKFPIDAYDGLPALTDDLMWREGVPLFVTGKFAALRLGPGAGNLEGARLGAERVAWGLREILDDGTGSRSGEAEGEGEDEVRGGGRGIFSGERNGSWVSGSEDRFVAGVGSRFESLAVEGWDD